MLSTDLSSFQTDLKEICFLGLTRARGKHQTSTQFSIEFTRKFEPYHNDLYFRCN